MHGLLDRLGISLKRGRLRLHSPDVNYLAKLQDVNVHVHQVWLPTTDEVLFFQDEFTYRRQPDVATAYADRGHEQICAQLSYRSDLDYRVAAALDAHCGRVIYLQRQSITIRGLEALYIQICAANAGVKTVYLAQDNWPVHFHPDVIALLEPQLFPWPRHVPANWPTEPTPRAHHLNLPIQLLPLPTYAPWTNPIEKLWRWLRQDVLHLHRYADRWDELKALVAHFLDQFGHGSQALLHYVGLTAESHQYGLAIASQWTPPPVMRLNS
jgi:hypothetical protein